jgi:hypothetical protein
MRAPAPPGGLHHFSWRATALRFADTRLPLHIVEALGRETGKSIMVFERPCPLAMSRYHLHPGADLHFASLS